MYDFSLVINQYREGIVMSAVLVSCNLVSQYNHGYRQYRPTLPSALCGSL